jgi:NADH-quinone oxidoreductase subunit M
MLWMLQRVLFGEVNKPENAKLRDLNARELGLILPLMFLMLFMGVYPRVFLDRSQASVAKLQKRVNQTEAGGTYETAEVQRTEKGEPQR